MNMNPMRLFSVACKKFIFLAVYILDVLFIVSVAIVVIFTFRDSYFLGGGTIIYGMPIFTKSIFSRWRGSVMVPI